MEYLKEIELFLQNFAKTTNQTLEQKIEYDAMFVEQAFYINNLIIEQQELCDTLQAEFDSLVFYKARDLMQGKVEGIPKLAATDANRNAAVLLIEEKKKLIKTNILLKRLKATYDVLFLAINANARSIRVDERVR